MYSHQTNKQKRIIFWITQLVIWSLYFLYEFIVVHGYSRVWDRPKIAMYCILLSYFGIPLSLLLRYIYFLIRKFSNSRVVLICTVILSSVVAANIWFGEIMLLDQIFSTDSSQILPVTFIYYLWEIFSASVALLTSSAIYLLTDSWYDLQLQKEKTEQAMLFAQSSQLQMLRYQLNPHFLFNALSSLRALVRVEPTKAESIITKISEFLRYSIVEVNTHEVPLIKELEMIKHYLEIEKVRFDDELEVNFDIDILAEDFPIYSFLLNPLIENAIKHGMQTSSMPLKINVGAKVLKESSLEIVISNTGKWLNPSSNKNKMNTNTGLTNLRKRLEFSYPGLHTFSIKEVDGKVIAKLIIKKILEKNNEKQNKSYYS